MRNIALIGASGCGKTTVGKKLAQILGMGFTDTDELIEELAGMSITQIFDVSGEPYFRELETRAIKKAAQTENGNTVIATGGGSVLNKENIAALNETGVIVYLRCEPETILRNIRDDTSRPLMRADDKLERIKQTLAARIHLYEKFAEYTIDVNDITACEAAERIAACL